MYDIVLYVIEIKSIHIQKKSAWFCWVTPMLYTINFIVGIFCRLSFIGVRWDFIKKNAQLAIATCQSGGAYGGYTCMCQDVSIARHQFDLLPWLKSNN